ncbi:AraC family transcriptional regulator [Cupriavidus necator]|uniref:AraC family transcriptional regulator n=1 Tax=Cupriavidus necator TaxID=106590 RepID=UPI0005B4A9A4|nr:AraC family transcriptional regulator [Cupriavidus necator]
MKEDPLTDILTLASARCVDVGSLAAGGSWALRFPPPRKLKFVAVMKGECWLTIEGKAAPRQVMTGDVFVLPADRAFVLAGDLKTTPVDCSGLFADALEKMVTVGHGVDFFAVGAHIALDQERGKLLSEVLPPCLHIGSNSAEASAMQWLLNQLGQELVSDRPGAALASRQLAQLLCIQTIRSYLEASGPHVVGWIKALSDERLAPALRLMHREPSRAWGLGELAKEVAMSRTSFSVRFKAIAGIPPLAYLQNLRMRFAEYQLRESSISISELGCSLGYSSENAFSSAFKRSSGMAPGRYRAIFAKMDR